MTFFRGLTFKGVTGVHAVKVSGSTFPMEEITFDSNPGGGLLVTNNKTKLTLTDTKFTGNGQMGVTNGAGIRLEDGEIDARNILFSGNFARKGAGLQAIAGKV